MNKLQSIFQNNRNKITTKKSLENKIKRIDIIVCIIGYSSIFSQLYENDLFFENNSQENFNITMVRSANTILSAILIALLFRRRYLELQFFKSKNIIEDSKSFKEYCKSVGFFLEIFIGLMHSPPGITFYFELPEIEGSLTYSSDTILTILSLMRLYLAWRVFAGFSFWHGDLAQQICSECHCMGGSLFAIKCELKERPIIMISFYLSTSVVLFGMGLRTCERPYMEVSGLDFDQEWNGLWCIIITITTVGFGDFFPSTNLGRLLGVFGCLWGNFLISLLIVAMSSSLEFTRQEKRAYGSFIDNELNKKKKKFATILIIKFWKLQKYKQKNHKIKQKSINQFGNALKKWKEIKRKEIVRALEKQKENILLDLSKKIETEIAAILKAAKIITYLNQTLDKIEISILQLKSRINDINGLGTSIKEKMVFIQGKERGQFKSYSQSSNEELNLDHLNENTFHQFFAKLQAAQISSNNQ